MPTQINSTDSTAAAAIAEFEALLAPVPAVAAVAVAATAASSESAKEDDGEETKYTSVWEFSEAVKKVDEVYDQRGKKVRNKKGELVPGWECLYCKRQFPHANATKALMHISKTKGHDVAVCRSPIPVKLMKRYCKLRDEKIAAKAEAARKRGEYEEKVDEKQQTMSVTMENKCLRMSASVKTRSNSVHGEMVGGLEASHATTLTTAIAEFCFARGLPFDITECYEFRKVLILAKMVSTAYLPPNRKAISNELLEISYEKKMEDTQKSLLKEADVFGLSFYGDSATIGKLPLTNLMASGVEEHSAVLDIVDSSDHMAAGGIKDGTYIANLFEPWIKKLDPTGSLSDLVLFDGTGNVQLGGEILCARFPGLSSGHGAEHVASLIFNDATKSWQIKTLVAIYRKTYAVLGSGSQHAPKAIFTKQTLVFNHGRVSVIVFWILFLLLFLTVVLSLYLAQAIGLIRAAETRMAGYFYAFHRLLRLKDAVMATIASKPFKEDAAKKKPLRDLAKVLEEKEFWQALYQVTKTLFPILRILRLADRSSPGMDKLYYFVRKTDEALEKSLVDLNMLPYFLVNNHDTVYSLFESDEGDEDNAPMDEDDDDDVGDVGGEDGEDTGDDTGDADGNDLGDALKQIWEKRREQLISDYAITGKLFPVTLFSCPSLC